MKSICIIWLIAMYFVTGCDDTDAYAREHLQSLGYKGVSCTPVEQSIATCAGEGGVQFHCVARAGCNHVVACERFYFEKPLP